MTTAQIEILDISELELLRPANPNSFKVMDGQHCILGLQQLFRGWLTAESEMARSLAVVDGQIAAVRIWKKQNRPSKKLRS